MKFFKLYFVLFVLFVLRKSITVKAPLHEWEECFMESCLKQVGYGT